MLGPNQPKPSTRTISPRGWRAKCKPSLKSSPVRVGVDVERLVDLFDQWPATDDWTRPPEGAISPLDVSFGPFWRRGVRDDWYVQMSLDLDGPCRECLRTGRRESCSHKHPPDIAMEEVFDDVETLLDIFGRYDLEVSGFEERRFVQRDLTLVSTGRRGIEVRFERLMTPSTARGIASMLEDLASELPTLDLDATRQLERPRRAVLSQHPGDGRNRQGLRIPLDPARAPETSEEWQQLQTYLLELGDAARTGELSHPLHEIFGSVWMPRLERPSRAPEHWRAFVDRFDGDQPTSRTVYSDTEMEPIRKACQQSGLEVRPAQPYGILPLQCPRCGEKTGYLDESLLLRCHRQKCDATKKEDGIPFPDWTYEADYIEQPQVLRTRLMLERDAAATPDHVETHASRLDADPFASVSPFEPWWVLKYLHRHPDADSRPTRDLQNCLEQWEPETVEIQRGPERIERDEWRDTWMPILESVDRLHLEYVRGEVWCTCPSGSRYRLDPAILDDLKTVRQALREFDRLVVTTLDDVRRLPLEGPVWTLEIPVRLLNKSQRSDASGGDRLSRWRLAHHFADETESPLDIASMLDKKLEEKELMETAQREHRALPSILRTESPCWSFKRKEAKQELRQRRDELRDAAERLQSFVGPLAHPRQDGALRTRLAQEGVELEQTTLDALEGIPNRAEVPREALVNLRRHQSKVNELQRLLRASDDEGNLETTVDPLGTCTGRLSNRDPNLMGLDRDLRGYFEAHEGCKLVACDFSQIQIRILADYSVDEHLLEAFEEGRDIHRFVASQVFDCSEEAVTPTQRTQAKAVSIGVIMGMGREALAEYATSTCDVDTSPEEAGRILDDYFSSFPGVREFRQRLFERAKQKGCVRARSGRRCQLVDVGSLHEGQVLSYLLQMTEADMLKDALIRLSEMMRSEPAAIVTILHDEIVMMSETSRESVFECLPKAMQEAAEAHLERCPTGKIQPHVGMSWSKV